MATRGVTTITVAKMARTVTALSVAPSSGTECERIHAHQNLLSAPAPAFPG